MDELGGLQAAVIAFILIAIIGAVGVLILGGFGTSSTVLSTNPTSTLTSASSDALGYNSPTVSASNTVLTFTGDTSWISSTTPLTVTLFGNVVTTAATNAVGGNALSTGTFTQTLSFASKPTGVTTFASNFLNIQTVTVNGVIPSATGLVVTVTQNFGNTIVGSAPVSNDIATIVATGTVTVTSGGASNSISFGTSAVSTIMSFLPLLGLVIIAAAIITVVLVAFRFGGASTGRY